MNRSRILWSLCGTLLVAGAFGGGAWFGEQRVHARGEWADARLLSTAIDSVRVNALDSLPSDELIRRAVAGMLRELQDPYASIMRPDGYQRYRGSLQGDAQGLGVTLRRQGSTVTISRVAAGSPAAIAGARTGDRVLSVNDVPIAKGWGRTEADTSTAPLDVANLVIWRAPNGDTVRVTVRRGEWHSRAVSDAAMLTDSVAYVRLGSITAKTSSELEHAVDSLQAHGAESLILDLRGNAGGLFEEGVRAAGLFLKRGLVVASLDGRRGTAPEPHYAKKSRWTSMPITVLVDANTASAAEVIAAALRDHRRALIVGTPTYGKGVVQRVVKLTPELSMRLTTARWLTPNGETLVRRHGTGKDAKGGMIPDVLLDDAVRRDAFALPRDWSVEAVSAVSAIADSASMQALREGWSTSPLWSLESRLRERIAAGIPKSVQGDAMRAAWLNTGTRLATVRMLEAAGALDALLRYSVREDGTLRAGLDVLEPGSTLVQVIPSIPPVTLPVRRASAR